MLPVWDHGLCFQRKQNPYMQIIVYVCSNMCEGYLKDTCKAFNSVLLRTHSRQKNSKHCSKTLSGKQKSCSYPDQKIIVEIYSRFPEAWRKSWRENIFGKSGYSKECIYNGEFRKPHTCPRQDTYSGKI